ncbi:MAG: SulP family inorganic anion transporter [Betaproteobacteria bacterium]
MTPLALKLLPFLSWRERITRDTMRADVVAGLVGALVVLPQAVAYATLAGMPPEYGLYCAMLPVVVAALWGSSWHQVSGPTNTISLAIFAMMAPLASPGSPTYVNLVLTLALMIGLMQLAMGLARLGTLVNFISHTVVVGFTAGAGLLIMAAQIQNFFGIPIPAGSDFIATLQEAVTHAAGADPWIVATSAVTLAAALAARRLLPRIPYMIVAMIAGSVFAYGLAVFGQASVPTIGTLPREFPPLSLPSFDPAVWRSLAPAALALTTLALAQAVSVARTVAARSGQRIDGNQEFIGQGLSNIVGAFASGYPSSGSFNRVWVNFEAGAKTPLAAVFSAAFLLAIVLAVAPLGAHLPLAVMAALLVIVAWGLIDVAAVRRIVRAGRGETLVLVVTFMSTLLLQLEFAILLGVLTSLFVYLNRTTHPQLTPVAPDGPSTRRHFVPVGESRAPECPQLAMLRVDGSLYFGAVEHVRDVLHDARLSGPRRRHLLLIGSGINFIDVAGAELLVHEAMTEREAGGALYLCTIKPGVLDVLMRGGYLDRIGRDCYFESKAEAIHAIYARLDADRCRTCTARIFTECQSVLPDGSERVA